MDDVSFEVPTGSIFGLLGHNGAGKSTTLGVLLGQVFPDAGEVEIHGHDVFADRAGALGRVGAIFESPAFYDYLSGRRNLALLTRLTGRVTRERMAEVIELVGLTDRIDDRVRTYSHGMRQRLALAQALLPDPKLLILDEPTDGLDPEGIHEVRELVRRLHREFGMTIIFSSHLLYEVEQLCTHVAVLKQSKLIFCDTLAAAGTGARYLRLECDRRDEAVAALKTRGWITAEGERLRLTTDTDPADLTAFLVLGGYRVAALATDRMSLEDFYLQALRKNATQTIDGQAATPNGSNAASNLSEAPAS